MTPLKEALAALADALAKRPAEEILFDWFRSGRLVGELSVLIKRRHPDVQVEIDLVYQEHRRSSAKGRVTRHRTPAPTRPPSVSRHWRIQPGHDGQYCAVGIAPEQAAAGSPFKYRALEVREGERTRRLGEIDCAVGCFSHIRAELQVPPVDLFDQCLELAAAGVHRQQSSRTVAHQQAPVAGDGQAQRSSTVSPTTAV